ncbi:MAG: DUF433 domain-containing protein [Acidobacteriota bacterium]
MNRTRWTGRVVIDPELHHGDPCIKGTRIPVSIILGSLADGMNAGAILVAYPQLSVEDIQAALAYAAEVVHQEVLMPLPS